MDIHQHPETGAALCQSCDRCRARKTRCDGQRPCHGCITKYMKTHEITSVEGVPMEALECIYSPAKRRGPVPGRTQQKPKQSIHLNQSNNNNNMLPAGFGFGGEPAWPGVASTRPSIILDHLKQAQQQQQQQHHHPTLDAEEPATRRIRTTTTTNTPKKTPDTVAAHLHLLERSSPEGNRLRAYFRLSVDELFTLTPILSDAEFDAKVGVLSTSHKKALLASRFSEVALGALVHNEVPLAMELCNATVHCLRECCGGDGTEMPVSHPAFLLEVSRAYFLLGAFRAFRGDMERYFKYRRVCMTHLSKFQDDEPHHEMLLAAISFLDSWAYMIYNANEKELPEIDAIIPQVPSTTMTTEAAASMGGCSMIVSDPKNKMWIQGAPPVYLNNEAPLPARSLDALACAVRQCCDQANMRFAAIAQEANEEGSPSTIMEQMSIPQESILTPTKTAVMANENELCSRNMVLSAFTLLQQHEASSSSPEKNQGHHLIISAMDAFLENGDEDGAGGFTDSQIQSLLSVCNIVIENPYLLYHAGPTYHMVSNSAVLICHLLNGMYAMQHGNESHPNSEMEKAVFDEILDTFLSVRKLLNIHRRKLPVMLRCHGIPRPDLFQSSNGTSEGKPFIDLGNTLMCACRGCQGFVLMACSPCVAAERAQAAARKQEVEMAQETLDMDQDLYDFGNEFDLDDDALLNMLSRIIAT